MVNLFVLKTIAITAILQSQSMVELPNNPGFGESIAKNFCKFFSKNIEDFRLRGDRSVPLQNLYAEKTFDPRIFYHTSLFFLTGYMKFENNFASLYKANPSSKNEEQKDSSGLDFSFVNIPKPIEEEEEL